MKVQVHGLRRTGTHLAKDYLRNFFDVEVVGAHTHAMALWDNADITVVTAKDPLSWLAAVRNWFAQQPGLRYMRTRPMSDFLSRAIPWESPRFPTVTPVERYNLGQQRWLEGAVSVLRHEDVLEDMPAAFGKLGDAAGLKKTARLRTIKRRIGIPNGAALDTAYYTEKRYLNLYTEGDLQFIEERLDPDVISLLGYPNVSELRQLQRPLP